MRFSVMLKLLSLILLVLWSLTGCEEDEVASSKAMAFGLQPGRWFSERYFFKAELFFVLRYPSLILYAGVKLVRLSESMVQEDLFQNIHGRVKASRLKSISLNFWQLDPPKLPEILKPLPWLACAKLNWNTEKSSLDWSPGKRGFFWPHTFFGCWRIVTKLPA